MLQEEDKRDDLLSSEMPYSRRRNVKSIVDISFSPSEISQSGITDRRGAPRWLNWSMVRNGEEKKTRADMEATKEESEKRM